MNRKLFLFLAIFVSCIAVNVWDTIDANQTMGEITESRKPRTETHYGPAF